LVEVFCFVAVAASSFAAAANGAIVRLSKALCQSHQQYKMREG
jgi:hypothetical protein